MRGRVRLKLLHGKRRWTRCREGEAVRLPSEKREQATVLPADGVSPAGISAGGKGDAAKCSDVRVPGEGTSLATGEVGGAGADAARSETK